MSIHYHTLKQLIKARQLHESTMLSIPYAEVRSNPHFRAGAMAFEALNHRACTLGVEMKYSPSESFGRAMTDCINDMGGLA